MKLKSVLLAVVLTAPAISSAQPKMIQRDASGCFERGKRLYEVRNYAGAIDQLSQIKTLSASSDLQEQADYYIALSRFERNEDRTLDALNDFVKNYPSSLLLPDVLMRIGNFHFYRGDYGDALVAYKKVREKALNEDLNEDLIYRMAYCDLQLEDYKEARARYAQLKDTRRYNAAVKFFDAYIDYARHYYDAAYNKFASIDASGELGYQSQYYMCQINYRNKDYNQVISLGEKLLRDNVNEYFNPEINRLVGESYYYKNNTSKARKHLNLYFETTQDAVVRSAAYALGVMDFNDAKYAVALQSFNQVTGENDDLAQSAYFFAGQCQLQMGNARSASMAFEKAASMDHNRQVKENAFYNYAVAQTKGVTDPFGSSITLFEQFLNDYPESKYRSQVETHLVNAYMSTSNYDKAIASINRIEKPGAPILKAKQTVLFNMGVQAMQKGYRKDAANYLKQAIKIGNYDSRILNESRLWLAETQYIGKDYKNAISNLSAYVRGADKNDDNYPKALYNLGYAQYQNKQYADARYSFERALNTGRLEKALIADAYDRIADTYYYVADFQNAEANYDKAITHAVGAADGSMLDKALMAGQMKNYQSEIEQLNNLLSRYPESTKAPTAMLEIAKAYEAMGSEADASKAYMDLADKYPKSVQARKGMLQLAHIEKKINNVAKAIEAYKIVITLAPTSDEAKVAAEDLKVLYADSGELLAYKEFLDGIPGAPQFDINDVEQLTFNAAEAAITATQPNPAKMEGYLKAYPNGAFAAKAKYYVGRYNYEKGNTGVALAQLDEAINMGSDASWAEDALSMKCDILIQQGKQAEAIEVYKQIIATSASEDNKIVAQMGILSAAIDIKRYNEVVTIADELLKNPALTATEQSQIRIERAIAYANQGNREAAEADLTELSKEMDSDIGAEAAYQLALLKFNAGELKAAEKQVSLLLESGSSQAYWIARAYILESDILMKQANYADAREYLESLKDNYPGKEKDIFNDIDSRLKTIKAKMKAKSKPVVVKKVTRKK